METFFQDFRYGLRRLIKSARFTVAAITILALVLVAFGKQKLPEGWVDWQWAPQYIETMVAWMKQQAASRAGEYSEARP